MSSFDVENLPDAARRQLFAALVRAYARRGSADPPFDQGALSVDEVAMTVAAMMRSADVTSFELAALFDV